MALYGFKGIQKGFEELIGRAHKTSSLKMIITKIVVTIFLYFLILEKKVWVQFGNILEIFQIICQFMFLKIDQIS